MELKELLIHLIIRNSSFDEKTANPAKTKGLLTNLIIIEITIIAIAMIANFLMLVAILIFIIIIIVNSTRKHLN